MTETPSVESTQSEGIAVELSEFQIPEEQLNFIIQDTVGDFPEIFNSPQPQSTLGSDSEGVIENLLENGEEIIKDLKFKKIVDNYLKPRDFPGVNKLDLKLPDKMDSKYGYSSNLDKLFIQRNAALSVILTYDRTSPTAQYSVLASIIFTDPEHENTPVKVCLNHRDRSKGDLADHFLNIRSAVRETRYFTAQNGLNMLKIENLPNISDTNRQETQLHLVFTDLSSCIGGVNRRDVCVVFCLEEKDRGKEQIVSSKVLNVKVSENAKRDMLTQEKQRKPKVSKVVVKSSEGEDRKDQFWVLATNKRNYKALLEMGALIEGNGGGNVDAWRQEVEQFNQKKTRIELDDGN